MVLSPNASQPPYPNQDNTATQDLGDDPTNALLGVGAYFGVFTLIIPSRVVFDRTASTIGTPHLYRGFLATLCGGVHDLVGGYKQLWREGGVRMFVRWPVLGFTIGVGAYVIQEGAQQVCHWALGVTEEDIEERSFIWHVSKATCLISAGVLLYPVTILWTLNATNRMPSWRVYFREKLLRGKDYFYSGTPLSCLSFLTFFAADIVRAKMLHGFKKTFFPDLLPSRPSFDDNEEDDDEESATLPVALPGGTARPYMYMISSIALYTLWATGCALAVGPIDAVGARIVAHPLVYGPLGILGTIKTIYREEGAWAFYKGYVPNLLFLLGTYFASIGEEADNGKPPL